MKYEVFVNKEKVFELSDLEVKIIKNEINADEFLEDFYRRITWIMKNKVENVLQRLIKEWSLDKDKNGKTMLENNGIDLIPSNDFKLAELIFSQPNYKDCKTKYLEYLKNKEKDDSTSIRNSKK